MADTLNYDKWDRLEEYDEISDDSDEDGYGEIARPKLPAGYLERANQYGKSTIITVPWEMNSERLRWAMDRHYRQYLEKSYPFGFHILFTAPFSKPIPARQYLDAPILEAPSADNEKEVYRTLTDQQLYLMSKSLGSKLRMYPGAEVLGLEEQMEKDLAHAGMSVFYYTVFTSPKLEAKYIFGAIRIEKIAALYRLAWPVMKLVIKQRYNLSEETVRTSFQKAEEVFTKIGDILKKHNTQFICGDQFTAADLAFSCFAAPFMLASQEDVGAHLAVSLPEMKEAPAWIAAKAKALRATPAGKHAIKCIRRQRGGKDSFRTKESRYDLSGRPWWSHKNILLYLVGGTFVFLVLLFLVLWDWVSRVLALLYVALLVASVFGGAFYLYSNNKPLAQRIWFARYGVPVEPQKKPVSQVKMEREQEKKKETLQAKVTEIESDDEEKDQPSTSEKKSN